MSDEPADDFDVEPMPMWLTKDGQIHGPLLRYDILTRSSFAWQDCSPDVVLDYLHRSYQWVLEGELPKKGSLSAIKGGKE